MRSSATCCRPSHQLLAASPWWSSACSSSVSVLISGAARETWPIVLRPRGRPSTSPASTKCAPASSRTIALPAPTSSPACCWWVASTTGWPWTTLSASGFSSSWVTARWRASTPGRRRCFVPVTCSHRTPTARCPIASLSWTSSRSFRLAAHGRGCRERLSWTACR